MGAVQSLLWPWEVRHVAAGRAQGRQIRAEKQFFFGDVTRTPRYTIGWDELMKADRILV